MPSHICPPVFFLHCSSCLFSTKLYLSCLYHIQGTHYQSAQLPAITYFTNIFHTLLRFQLTDAFVSNYGFPLNVPNDSSAVFHLMFGTVYHQKSDSLLPMTPASPTLKLTSSNNQFTPQSSSTW